MVKIPRSLPLYALLLIGGLCLSGTEAKAQKLSLGLGWHNPPGATVGLNAMWLWTNVAAELGLGWVKLDSVDTNSNTDQDTSTMVILGDANLKYLFMSGALRPYIQGGFGTGVYAAVGDVNDFDIGIGGGFLGAGLYLMVGGGYLYGSYNLTGEEGRFAQAGVGFWL